MEGAGYDIGASLSASTSSSATGGQIGATSLVDNSNGGNNHNVVIIGVLAFMAMVFWVIFHEKN